MRAKKLKKSFLIYMKPLTVLYIPQNIYKKIFHRVLTPNNEQHQHAQQEKTIAQHTPNPLNSEKKIEPLSNQEIARRVEQDPSVQYGQREVQYWCKMVYNDPFILQYRMEDMQNQFQIWEKSLSFKLKRIQHFLLHLRVEKTLA
ncbi:BID domain-containing T4SS effector [Bartonella krasnovii]|uniref:BID domain-containing T4SS effector n=1 Tax=Bartonella krasnovii TaxID=2267275 RepID=UPI001F4D23FB|nr:BID domain-containing T4SS effector [Bartonella krasnovii]UNF53234.1 BID domain-containing T4SS effector [Bartonella krasnovii]